VAFSADNQLLASGSVDGTIKLWDAKTGEEKYNLNGHTNHISAVVFLPSGILASGSHDGTVRFWDSKRGKEIKDKKIHAHGSWILTLALSPRLPSSDGQLLASGSADRTIKIWDSGTGTEGSTLVGHSGWVRSVAFSPLPSITQMLASASDDETVRLWDVKAGREIRRMEGHEWGVNAVAFSHNGELLASASDDQTIRLWDTQTGNAMRKLEGHSNRILAVAFSTSLFESQALVSVSLDKSMRLWNTDTGKETRKLEGHDRQINGIAFSPGGKVLASVSDDKTCRLWDMELGGRPQTMEDHSGHVSQVVFSPNGEVVVSFSSEHSTIRMWNSQTGAEAKRFEGHSNGVTDVAISPDGQTLASTSFDGTTRVWDVSNGNEIYKPDGCLDSSANAIAFSPNGKILAAALPHERAMLIWDVETGTESRRWEYEFSKESSGLLFSPDSRLLTAVPSGRTIRIFDMEGDSVQRLQCSHECCTALTFSPDSLTVASASIEDIKLWDTRTGNEKHMFQDPETGVDSELGFDGLDGTSEPANDAGSDLELETSSEELQEDSAHLAELDRIPGEGNRATQTLEFLTDNDRIGALAFSPDGKVLALASTPNNVRLWDVESREIVQGHVRINNYIYSVNMPVPGETQMRIADFTGCSLAEHTSCSHETVSATTSLEIKNQWYLGQDVLWLPQEFRGSCWSGSGHKIAIGHHSGSVSFFHFR
jgi:WD40 repeat protein